MMNWSSPERAGKPRPGDPAASASANGTAPGTASTAGVPTRNRCRSFGARGSARATRSSNSASKTSATRSASR